MSFNNSQERESIKSMEDVQYTPSCSFNFYDSRDSALSENDVSQYLKSLRARLGFARFKMNQGWENSTIFDVEQLWRQKQQKMINNLPRPRFTQQDIIDKRVYVKKQKLFRTHSSPFQLQPFSEDDEPICKKKKPYARKQKPSPPPKLRNSLDYLSYAIAMTEEAENISSQPLPDISEIEPNINQDLEDLSITSIPRSSSPSSPMTSAAKTIMMFVNNSNQQSTGYGKKPLYSQ